MKLNILRCDNDFQEEKKKHVHVLCLLLIWEHGTQQPLSIAQTVDCIWLKRN